MFIAPKSVSSVDTIYQKIVKKKAAKSLPIPVNRVILAMTWNFSIKSRKQKLTNF